MSYKNWNTAGAPLLIDIGRQIVTRILPSSPLALRRYAWQIRRAPRLALRLSRAMILWEGCRTAAPPAYHERIYTASSSP